MRKRMSIIDNGRAGGDTAAWRVQDKINEIRGKLTLKMRDQEAYYTFSQQQIKENDALIKTLRAEIHEKRVIRKKSLNADNHVIREGFKNDRESQLAMQRYTAEKAVAEKTEHVFEKIKALNKAKHVKEKRIRRKNELVEILQNIKIYYKDTSEIDFGQRMRVLMTSIEKMRLKYSSASYIQKTYQKILRHLEHNNRLLPMRLEALEESIRENRNELNGEWYQIQLDSRKAYENTKHAKEKMEEKIHKDKRHRDSKLAEVRKRFKRMNQKEEEKIKPRRTVARGTGMKSARRPSISFWENVRQFWKVKRSLDVLRDSMSLSHASDIAPSFQRQLTRKKELEQTVRDLTLQKRRRQKELKMFQARLREIAEKYSARVGASRAETLANLHALQDSEEGVANQKVRLSEVNELLVEATLAIKAIHQRISTCERIPQHLCQRRGIADSFRSRATSRDFSVFSKKEGVVNILQTCEEKLYLIHQASEDDDFQMFAADFPSEEAKEMLVVATAGSPSNIRVCIADEDELETEDDFFEDDDDSNNDQYVTRDAIKSKFDEMMGNKITKAKQRHPAME